MLLARAGHRLQTARCSRGYEAQGASRGGYQRDSESWVMVRARRVRSKKSPVLAALIVVALLIAGLGAAPAPSLAAGKAAGTLKLTPSRAVAGESVTLHGQAQDREEAPRGAAAQAGPGLGQGRQVEDQLQGRVRLHRRGTSHHQRLPCQRHVAQDPRCEEGRDHDAVEDAHRRRPHSDTDSDPHAHTDQDTHADADADADGRPDTRPTTRLLRRPDAHPDGDPHPH